ncbi:4-keto-6-deoxy-N-Acetyl-D-hexosaminyl-(Lipid carrier) aminotransferase [Anaerovibrio sp. JC8]|uniref:DegT/DnrJ/EryC1/StrS family aminotransferase n=1 Tax=Anaerovibrio sp. JC8 TaxID=1240085 RepID=UPI000A0C280A|nr:DegT/DnrJ/EryC1/StrS family aminotransferase [Anaerovibrio sp. JC8]ORU00539.1 4-keto-6-deoxy-N-Acetyl-D-hexosaminyl-(Lipid carrier) aminotransferase [Anaerovibrio sp. JC8]
MRRVFVNEPVLDGNERKYINECIDTNWISFEGPFVKRFEQGMAELTDRKHAVAVSNGSVALDTAVLALKIGEGDEVIMPTFTIISCAAPLVRVGAKPVLIDADPLTFNMKVEDIEAKITEKTKAIMVVHIYGLPVNMDPVLDIAKKHNLYVIEDAAEMHGQTYKGRPCGSFGDISTFSFYPNKHITCGEGGMVLTNDDNLAERCALVRNLFFSPKKRYVHEELGYNFRMTNVQAALGCAQLEKLKRTVEKKHHIGALYNKLLKDVDGLQLPVTSTDYADNIYWVYGIVLDDKIPVDADEMMKRLGAEGIGCRGFFWGMHEQPVFKGMHLFDGEEYPVASRLARRGFYIPSGVNLTDDDQEYVVEKLKEVLYECDK